VAASLDREPHTMAARELDGRAVRIARENAGIVRKGTDTASEVKALRDDFERLRDENAKLRDRLDRIEARQPGAR
jgi:aminopeptidase N